LARPLNEAGAAPAIRRFRPDIQALRAVAVLLVVLPGAPLTLHFGGATLVAAYPLGPIIDGISLNITVQSYCDSLHVGLNACPKAVPEISRIAVGLDDALGESAKATSR